MNGYGMRALAAIDVELKESVCDALVNTIVTRVSGTDEAGRIVSGRSPRRSIVSGQLLPRFDVRGEDETSDIRIAALGLDFVLDSSSAASLVAEPSFSVYVRVLPTWPDIQPGAGPLDVDFRLKAEVHHQIEEDIKARRLAAFIAKRIDKPNWRDMDEAERSRVRAARGQVQEEIRLQAYGERGIRLLAGDDLAETETVPAESPNAEAENDPNTPDQPDAPPPPVNRLLREGRDIPLHLLDPAPIPPKWKRLDLNLPRFEWPARSTGDDLAARVTAYCGELSQSVSEQLRAWLNGDGLQEAWRDLTVLPADVASPEAWEAFLTRTRAIAPDPARLLPDLSRVVIRVERQADFLDPHRVSFRLALDNQCQELTPRDAQSLCNTIFGTRLKLSVPAVAHRNLQLDRVEPSYRFRHYLEYPAIGLNCGIEAIREGELLTLATTWSPRFVQPRTIPTDIGVPCDFIELADSSFQLSKLLELPEKYAAWVKAKAKELEPLVREGLDPDDADLETARLTQDIQGQLAEAGYIERGVRLLIVAQKAASQLERTSNEKERAALHRRALPWLAWIMMNEAFARRDGNEKGRGWRLFQLAFILAHVPTFASRLDEYRDAYDALLDEETASLLYFPTGGGKSEAFYGTLLFALFLDRLRGKDRGITALIRYPLRLLTLQQAQRLLKLLAHAELVRKAHKVGAWPFEIGFWVGSANTPNTYSGIRADVPRFGDANSPDDRKLEEDAGGSEEEVERGRRYREIRDAYDKIPDCPVCGHPTGLRRNEIEGPTAKRAAIVCFNSECDWNRQHGGIHPLPFLLTDDTIYERAPAIVLGTVDKLAMLGQHTNTIAKVLGMFGLARWVDANGHLRTERQMEKLQAGPEAEGFQPVFPSYRRGVRIFHDPFPSLIIQDEAHLLEESLGTFSGLFDTLLENVLKQIARIAGDDLGVVRKWTGDDWGDARMPKIVAATATISNPERQLETLYQRRPVRFPYPGPDIYRSFFAEPAKSPPVNPERVRLAQELPAYLSPEASSPWMRLYVSLMTNGATHTVTAVTVLSAFHTVITNLWASLQDPQLCDAAIQRMQSAVEAGGSGAWRRAAFDRAVAAGRTEDIMALVDLHRIALAYVTNKKGGDQIIDALDAAVRQQHRQSGYELEYFDSRLISGGVDMKEIQSVMNDAGEGFENRAYPKIDRTVRNIVATAAISHGVDVDRFNSMFFAGLPSDIAEYIQASSRVGRSHVGFVMLIPTPQNRRDRYVVETHDIFHRFLERMIAPPAVERWAENAVRRVLASFAQTWTMIREAEEFVHLDDANKSNVVLGDMVQRLGRRANRDMVGFCNDLGSFILSSAGFAGRGPLAFGSPNHAEHYRGLVDRAVQDFARDLARQATAATLRDYWEGQTPVFQKPMTSLRDVDEAGLIVASSYDPHATERSTRINRQDVAAVMRAIRSQKGEGAETDPDGGDE
jgi:Helicase conserved C-terminal domain